MHALLMAAVLAGCGCSESGADLTAAEAATAAEAIIPRLETGSLIFSTGDCLAVRIFTRSRYTHVAAVVMTDEGRPVVYDSMNGVGVRKLPLADYLSSQGVGEVHLVRPRKSLNAEQAAALEKALEAQLGRPYAIRHHVTGKRCEGLHCAEYITDALMTIDLVRAEHPSRVSPASLREGVLENKVYTDEETVAITAPSPPPSPSNDEGRCRRIWNATKSGCLKGCRQLSAWVLCR